MKRILIILFIALIPCLLPIIFSGCSSTKIEYEYIVPELSFPVWPNPGSEDFPLDPETNNAEVPLEYLKRLANYKKDINALEKYYLRCKELYNNEELNNGRKK